MSRWIFFTFILALCLIAATPQSLAQGTDLGTIRGTVKDPSGAVIPGAKVLVVDAKTNASRENTANAQGDFEMFGLNSGRYKVTVTSAGMSTEEINDVDVTGS